jgi:hypothetical protein
MTARARLEKLEKAQQIAQTAAIDAWISALTDDELECLCRDTANEIRTGKMRGDELREYCRLSDTPNLTAWLESVPLPQPGDAEELARIMATAPVK